MSFTRNISKFVEIELRQARNLDAEGQAALAFTHLENAHVLGQRSTKWHTLAHYRMFLWALRHRDFQEVSGQILRMVGAITKTVFGRVPDGNTGGANVSPFRPMDINPVHAKILEKARRRSP